MSKILIIEDETSIQNIIKAFLEDAGYLAVLAKDGMEGFSKFHECRPDLILLDLLLPKIDGLSLCKMIRKESQVPIIMLTALDDDNSQINGFDALADDYITKPFSMPLVVRRIEAVFRRFDQSASCNTVIRYKSLCLDTDGYEVTVNSRKASLTAREFDILKLLLENQERAVRIPMIGDIRSLNLANSVAVVLYEALRQNHFDHMRLDGHLTRYDWK